MKTQKTPKKEKIEDLYRENFFYRNSPFWHEDNYYNKKQFCIHCYAIIEVKKYKVVGGLICCPNYPECNGTIIDWLPVEAAEQYK